MSETDTKAKVAESVARVVVNIPVDKVFDYSVPPSLMDKIARGKRLKVPFGPRVATGYCIGTADRSEVANLKPIIRVIDEVPILDDKMLELTRWMATYYHCSWGEALDAVLPGGVKRASVAPERQYATLAVGDNAVAEAVTKLTAAGREAQAKVLERLARIGRAAPVAQVIRSVGCSASPVVSLEKAGLIMLERLRNAPDPFFEKVVARTEPPALTRDQEAVLGQIDALTVAKRFGVVLLHGVTGSGKTEVYLKAIDRVVRLGRQAIVLVPEISLTPQAVRLFRERFDNVCVLHSMLSDTQRYSQWLAIRKGEPGVVIGPRSAIFAPVRDLGLLVIDEEHESTFKQQSTPRYHARDVGIMRAKTYDAPVVLGSATPSLESYHNAKSGKFILAELPERVEGRPMPKVSLVDMRNEFIEQKRQAVLSRQLLKEMEGAIGRGEQVILFINRRGFSTFVQCPRCGYVVTCVRCSISLTYHRKRNVALCHYCNASIAPPKVCPDCRGAAMKYMGAGTQKIEDLIARFLPNARVERMDSDSMRRRDAYEKTFNRFRAGEIDILVGTQMIAKGLDFPNVTLVGVIAADMPLALPDFRASERTFQLLAQVAGRTGRGDKGGQVIVQACDCRHFSIAAAALHDYAAFANQELPHRRAASYPPYARMARVVVEGDNEQAVKRASGSIAEKLQPARGEALRLLGPAPAPIELLEGLHRYHVLLIGQSSREIHAAIEAAKPLLKSTGRLRVTVDVDPTQLM